MTLSKNSLCLALCALLLAACSVESIQLADWSPDTGSPSLSGVVAATEGGCSDDGDGQVDAGRSDGTDGTGVATDGGGVDAADWTLADGGAPADTDAAPPGAVRPDAANDAGTPAAHDGGIDGGTNDECDDS